MKGKSVKTIHVLLFLVVIAVLIWTLIKLASFMSWTLEATPAIIVLIIALLTYKKFRLNVMKRDIRRINIAVPIQSFVQFKK